MLKDLFFKLYILGQGDKYNQLKADDETLSILLGVRVVILLTRFRLLDFDHIPDDEHGDSFSYVLPKTPFTMPEYCHPMFSFIYEFIFVNGQKVKEYQGYSENER